MTEVTYAKASKVDGKKITDRTKVKYFRGAVVQIVLLRQKDGRDSPGDPGIADVHQILGSLEGKISLTRTRVARAGSTPSLYMAISKLEPWMIALLSGQCQDASIHCHRNWVDNPGI